MISFLFTFVPCIAFIKNFIRSRVYLLLTALGLCYCTRAFSSWGKWGCCAAARSFSLQWLFLSRSTGSRHRGFGSCSTQPQQWWIKGSRAQVSVIAARELSSCGHGLSGPATHGIFPDQGSNLCPLH